MKKRSQSVQDFDVIIVGAGMVGATLAVLLLTGKHTRCLKIAIVDAADPAPRFEATNFDPRVVALSKQSERLLKGMDVWQSVLNERACPYYQMNIWDAEGTGNIQFHAEDIHEENLGHIVESSLLVRALHEKLQQNESLTYFKPYRVKDYSSSQQRNTLLLETTEQQQLSVCAPLVVAADGAHSKLRELAGIKTREWDYGHTAIVTTVKHQQAHQNCCWQRFTQQGPIAFLPLQQADRPQGDDQHYSSLVWSAETELAKALMALDERAFCVSLSREFESRLGNVESCANRFAIPLRQRHAVDYICEGMALVGDAAHTIHPLAGQGVNLGLYDAQALAAEIARVCERGVPLSDGSLLRRYQRARKTHNLSAMVTMEGFKRLFAADQPAIRCLRNTGMSFFNSQLYLKKQLARVAAGQL